MSEEDIKRRIISFRVSDDEYGTVEKTSRQHGFVSVSLFARSATLKCDSSGPVQSTADVEINRLWRRVEVLTKELEALIANAAVALKFFNRG